MKKFVFMIMMCFVAMTSMAQNEFAKQKFSDNWSVTLQGGVVTGFDDMFGHVSPTIVVGADKYITPGFGFGVEGRTAIASPSGVLNPHTAFDAVNVSGYAKFNLINIFKWNGNRRLFEPVVYTGLGWGHTNCDNAQYPWVALNGVNYGNKPGSDRNYLTYRAGAELNFNVDRARAWAVVVNPSVVWGDIDNMKLNKHRGNFELTAGVVYHFKNSNKRHDFSKIHPRIITHNVEVIKEVPVEKVVEVVKEVTPTIDSWTVKFPFNQYELTDEAKVILDQIPSGSSVKVDGYASYDGCDQADYNIILSNNRAVEVKTYLEKRGITVTDVMGNGAGETGRVAIVTLNK